jgi:hypothetical protein
LGSTFLSIAVGAVTLAAPAAPEVTYQAFKIGSYRQRLYSEHFPFPGVGKIVKHKTGYVWVPESLN